MIYGVSSREIDSWWDLAEGYVTSALDYGIGEYTSDDIKEACQQQRMQLWMFGGDEVEGCFVTQMLDYPQLRVLLVLLLGGNDFDNYKGEVDELLNRFGKDKDCSYIEFFGRKGWGNFLKDLEYKEQVRMFSKEIL